MDASKQLLPVSYDVAHKVMEQGFLECLQLHQEGYKEYAGDQHALFNFDDESRKLGVTPEVILSVYMNKHLAGIQAYVRGHRSQRESVLGRINDAVVYLMLFRAMVLRENNPQILNDIQQEMEKF